jgi:CDP-diacylglycerol--serine O-phosphatidyltransferase
MRKVHLLPNLITAFGLSCGLFVIFKVNMLELGAGSYEVILKSALLLLIAGFADFIDGAVARMLHAESEFGSIFDTLSDSIAFGVAPSVLLLKSLSLEQGTFLSFCAAIGCMIFSLCGVLRLVRFNVTAQEAKKNIELMHAQKKHFTGLPIPAGAMAAVSANLIFLVPSFQALFPISFQAKSIGLTAMMIVLGYLMICRLKFPSLKALNLRLVSFDLIFLSVTLAIVILYGILYFFPFILVAISWSYIIISLVLSLVRCVAGKKLKTLEEFDPEPEDFEDS